VYELDIHSPNSLKEALVLKKDQESLQLLAGGTDVLVNLLDNQDNWDGKPALLNLSKLDELRFVRESENMVEIGPLMTHNEIISNHLLRKHIPVLCKAASFIGSPQIRNQGTICGNIVNASPAGDTLPILYARDALIEVSTIDGQSLVPLSEFIKGPGLVDLDPRARALKSVYRYVHIGTEKKSLILGLEQWVQQIKGQFNMIHSSVVGQQLKESQQLPSIY